MENEKAPRFQSAIPPPPPPPLSRSRRHRQEIERETLTKLFLLRRQPCVHVLHHPADDPELLTTTAIATTTALRLIPCRRSRNRCCLVCGSTSGTWRWLGSCGKSTSKRRAGTGGQRVSTDRNESRGRGVRCHRRCCLLVQYIGCWSMFSGLVVKCQPGYIYQTPSR